MSQRRTSTSRRDNPCRLEQRATTYVNKIIVGMAAQGWENVGLETASDTQYSNTAVYPFTADPDGKQLKDVMPDFTYSIREAENEYKVYKIEGRADFSVLEEFWAEMESNYAVNGISADIIGSLFDLEGEILSAQEVRAMISGYKAVREHSRHAPGSEAGRRQRFLR